MKRTLSLLLVVGSAALAGCGHAPLAAAHLPTASHASIQSVQAEQAVLEQIHSLANQAMQDASALTDWAARADATSKALQKIDQIPMQDATQSDLVAKLGLYAAQGYGYVGFKPQPESKYKAQAVVLQALAGTTSEAGLARGAGIFTLGGNMVTSAAGYDDGFKIGLSVLCVLRDFYKDATLSKQAGTLVQKALHASDKPSAVALIADGLKSMGAIADK